MHRRFTATASVLLLCVLGWMTLVSLVRQLLDPITINPYTASQYWLTYEHGFVRRGLPGTLLAITGTSRSVMTAAAVTLTLSAIVVIVIMCYRVASTSTGRDARWLALLLLVTSPLTVSLLVRDLGRYDGIGILVLGFFALTPLARDWPSARLATLLATLLLTVAVASEEFLFAFLVPVVWLWVDRSRRRFVTVTALPAAVALVSFLTRPSRSDVASVVAEVRAAGVRVGDNSAVGVLANTLKQQFDYVVRVDTERLLLSILVSTVSFVLLICLLRRFGVFDHLALDPRWLSGYLFAVVLFLGIVGVDYRRWWLLATVAVMAVVLVSERHVPPPEPRPGRVGRPLATAALLAALVFVGAQAIPVSTTWSWTKIRPAVSWSDPRPVVFGSGQRLPPASATDVR